MSLKMLEPWKNPRSKVFWFRRRVPAKYRAFGLSAEIKKSLDTTDYDEAVLRCQEMNVGLERQWRDVLLSSGRSPDELTHIQIMALAGEFYRETVSAHRADPGTPAEREQTLRDHEMRRRRITSLIPLGLHLRTKFGDEARTFLKSRGLHLVGDTYEKFIKSFVAARELAERELLKNASGDYSPDPAASKFPSLEVVHIGGKVGAFEMFDRYAAEAGLPPKTMQSWKMMVGHMVAFVGHDDLSRLTKKDVVNWKDHLLVEVSPGKEKPRDRRTIRSAYLAAVKATLRYGVEQQDLPSNVAEGVGGRVKKKKKQREKGFTLDEAHRILKTSLEPASARTTAEMAAAFRWVPWICAYTGARFNEVTQLLPSDFLVEEGINVIRLDADATKTDDYRKVPLHPHLIEQGLIDYVRSRGKRPLFYDPGLSRGGKEAQCKKVGQRLANWVRKTVKITDENVQPNHGWRHRFSSLARHVDMHVDLQNIIQGHVGETIAAEYGDAPIAAAYREILKLPRYVIIQSAMTFPSMSDLMDAPILMLSVYGGRSRLPSTISRRERSTVQST